MSKRIFMALAIVLVLALASGAWMSASAGGAEVPFKAYYPIAAVATYDPECDCMQQDFLTDGKGLASHLGVSQFSGHAQAWWGPPITQIGDGKLIAANGDYLTIHYEATAWVTGDGQHIESEGWYVVTGGSGRFKNVTGEGAFRTYVYMSGEQPNDLWFDGHLHKP